MNNDAPIRAAELPVFLADWYGEATFHPLGSEGQFGRIPLPLLEWHACASSWGGTVISSHNRPVSLGELSVDADGYAVFWIENQHCWEWAVKFDGSENPPVFDREAGDDEPEPWRESGQSLSEFMLWASILEAIQGAKVKADAELVSAEQVESISGRLDSVSPPSGRHYMAEVKFFSGPGVLVQIEEAYSGEWSEGESRPKEWHATACGRSQGELDSFLQKNRSIEWKQRRLRRR
ncbi:hypothetical protein ABZW30_38740 [Kitasatospora sp. NPDC004669]|uniref:hypothetical protein n=1 Tax=Kitasatospora sp. NPDC004669 TaxID=3154555 RepID=UPI0033B2AAB0